MRKIYYRIELRTNGYLSEDDIERLKRAIWTHLGNIPITDIDVRRRRKPNTEGKKNE